MDKCKSTKTCSHVSFKRQAVVLQYKLPVLITDWPMQPEKSCLSNEANQVLKKCFSLQHTNVSL